MAEKKPDMDDVPDQPPLPQRKSYAHLMARPLKNDNLVNNTLETELINGQQYVTTKEAARYLGMQHKTLIYLIADHYIPMVEIESRHLIEYGILKAFELGIRVMLR